MHLGVDDPRPLRAQEAADRFASCEEELVGIKRQDPVSARPPGRVRQPGDLLPLHMCWLFVEGHVDPIVALSQAGEQFSGAVLRAVVRDEHVVDALAEEMTDHSLNDVALIANNRHRPDLAGLTALARQDGQLDPGVDSPPSPPATTAGMPSEDGCQLTDFGPDPVNGCSRLHWAAPGITSELSPSSSEP